LASEILGDFESAQYWLNQSSSVLANISNQSADIEKARVLKYFMFLNKRLEAIKVLKDQVGGIK